MQLGTLIGEVRLDLTRASFPDGETVIHASSGIGEVRVLLPPDIPAAVRVSSLLGESEALGRVTGAFLGEAYAETPEFASASRRVRVIAQTMIGEVAVRQARGEGLNVSPGSPGAGFVPFSPSAAAAAPTAPAEAHGDQGSGPTPADG